MASMLPKVGINVNGSVGGSQAGAWREPGFAGHAVIAREPSLTPGSRYIVYVSQGGDGMRDIMALLLGDGSLGDGNDEPSGPSASWEEHDPDARMRQSRDWCQTPPGHTALTRLAASLAEKNRRAPRTRDSSRL